MIRYYCVVIFLFSFLNSSYSQETGIVKFLVEVDNGYFEIVINDTLYLKKYKDTLPVGNYSAKIWSPGYIMTEAEFEIKSGEVTEVFVPMAISNERINFENDYKEYRMNFHKSLTVPGSITLVTSLTTAYFMMKAYDHRKAVQSDIELYYQSSSTSEIANIKTSVAENNKKYNRNRFGYFISGGISALMLGYTIYSYRLFKRNFTEPKLDSTSPFKDRFSLFPTPYGCQLIISLG